MIAFDQLTWLHGKPQSSGLLKANPEDFLVVEDLGFAPDGEGEHVLVRILKNGIIIPKLARVRYRGARTMPRNAGTVPYFCCRYPCLIHTSNGLSQQPEEE